MGATYLYIIRILKVEVRKRPSYSLLLAYSLFVAVWKLYSYVTVKLEMKMLDS